MQDLKQRTFEFAVKVGKLILELINEGTEILKIIVSSINTTRTRVNSK